MTDPEINAALAAHARRMAEDIRQYMEAAKGKITTMALCPCGGLSRGSSICPDCWERIASALENAPESPTLPYAASKAKDAK
jgi:ATP-dependent helicase YprA (DUF1998 family)